MQNRVRSSACPHQRRRRVLRRFGWVGVEDGAGEDHEGWVANVLADGRVARATLLGVASGRTAAHRLRALLSSLRDIRVICCALIRLCYADMASCCGHRTPSRAGAVRRRGGGRILTRARSLERPTQEVVQRVESTAGPHFILVYRADSLWPSDRSASGRGRRVIRRMAPEARDLGEPVPRLLRPQTTLLGLLMPRPVAIGYITLLAAVAVGHAGSYCSYRSSATDILRLRRQ